MNISAVEKQIKKDFGDIFTDAETILENRGSVIPTTLSMDIALNGGILEGTVIGVAGNPGSGKTTFCLTLAANSQKLTKKKKVFYDDVEGRLEPELIDSIPGLDKEELRIIRPTKDKFLTAEDHLNIMTQILSNEEDVFYILDSVASLCPESNYSGQLGDSQKMMGIPTMMYNTLRKIAGIIGPMRSNLILITHVQANPSPYGGPAEMGGNAIKYQASTRLTCLSSNEVPKDGDKTGRESRFKVLKSSLGPGTGEATFYIRYGSGYDREADIVNTAEEYGFVNKSGAWYSYQLGSDEEIKVQGKERLIEYLQQNPKEADKLEQSIRKLVFKK